MRTTVGGTITCVLLAIGCTPAPDGSAPLTLATAALTGPSALPASAHTPAAATVVRLGSPPVLGGHWSWSRVEHVRMPYELAGMIPGVEPEGPMTHVRCNGSGTMALDQTGATFRGTATQTENLCATSGGQRFTPPGSDAPIIVDGRISGASIRFSFANAFLTPCPHAGTIAAVVDGRAQELEASGRCIVPGHPQSASPLPGEPPFSGAKTLQWHAVRMDP
jgi:hypothetical protein